MKKGTSRLLRWSCVVVVVNDRGNEVVEEAAVAVMPRVGTEGDCAQLAERRGRNVRVRARWLCEDRSEVFGRGPDIRDLMLTVEEDTPKVCNGDETRSMVRSR